jgi:hypothetical protein
VECLIVISILSILSALLQPAYRNLQNKSQILHCSQKLKDLGHSSFFLREDKNNHLPLGGYIKGLPTELSQVNKQSTVEGYATHYVGALAPYLDIPVNVENIQTHQSDLRVKENFESFLCPSHQWNSPTLLLHKSSTDKSLSMMGSDAGYAYTSYGSNESFSGYYNGYGAAGQINRVEKPDRVVFLSDAKSPNPYDYNILRSSTLSDSTMLDMLNSQFSARIDDVRHEGFTTVQFIDGHIEPLELKDLDQAWLGKGLQIQ